MCVKACEQIRYGVQAVFGPSDGLLASHVQSICDALDIPHLEARLDLEPEYKEFSINLYPAHDVVNQAFQDVMTFLNWTKVAILYEEDIGGCMWNEFYCFLSSIQTTLSEIFSALTFPIIFK